MDSTPENTEAETLIARSISNEITHEEASRLAQLCHNDPTVLESLATQILTHRLLFQAFQDRSDQRFASEVAFRLQSEISSDAGHSSLANKVGRILQFERYRKQILRLAAMVTVGCGLVWMWSEDSATARIERVEALSSVEPFQSGQALPAGKWIRFESGIIDLRFGCGAKVLVEGPAELEIQDAWHGYIRKGRVVASVGRRARGFTLDGPGGRLVDLGTKFAVSVEDGKGMELHVLEGLVEATPQGQKEALRVTKNKAIRLGGGTTEALVEADSGAFVTALPPKPRTFPRWIQWSFEEQGIQFQDRGHGLGPDSGLALHLPSSHPERTRVSGPFGEALQFDGDGTYAASPFKGIGGSEPRSVAFWVKVPADLKNTEGYAILSWGSRIQQGAAWQISINPTEKEGPVGRLRIGVHNAPVVGTRDLRDDQWHHCAVVMYGGSGADISTHVLLYVDGKLEPAARKTVMPVQTDTLSPFAHGVWLGRNLTVRPPTPHEIFSGPSFRGAVDEVFIFDAAIGQEEILRLMRTNAPR
ncbi:MAG: LamG-like jellyroll fold domain-containing protein [Verrucomicrobiota bacterium]